jgi:hypothetical protein
MNFEKGQEVIVLREYDLHYGVVETTPRNSNSKTVKIHFPAQRCFCEYSSSVPREKICLPEEIICVVWEIWRGVNGRGGYRIERNLYPAVRYPAKIYPFQRYVHEVKLGVVNDGSDKRL